MNLPPSTHPKGVTCGWAVCYHPDHDAGCAYWTPRAVDDEGRWMGAGKCDCGYDAVRDIISGLGRNK